MLINRRVFIIARARTEGKLFEQVAKMNAPAILRQTIVLYTVQIFS